MIVLYSSCKAQLSCRMNYPYKEVFMKNINNSNIRISVLKISDALWEDLKGTDWRIEFRYCMTVAIVPTILIMAGIFIYTGEFRIEWILPAWFSWLIYTSGTTHESRKANINDIFWCIEPFIHPSLPSMTRLNLLINHNLNIKEFAVLYVIQRLYLILGILLLCTVVCAILILQLPHVDENQLIVLYILD